MDQSSPSEGSACGNTVFTLLTSFKICVALLTFLLFLQDLFNWAIPLTFLGTFTIFLVLNKFKIPPASAGNVTAFFGIDFRPRKNASESFSTIRNKLQFPSQQEGLHQLGQALTIVGHRGAGLDAPENSISAFRHCKERGCPAVEFDVSVTKDNVPVVFHDDNILRMTGIDRYITDMMWEELRQVDISVRHPFGEKFQGERVPSFEEAITTCLSLGLKCFIDLKDNGDQRVVKIILDAFKKFPAMYNSCLVTSFSPKLVYLVRSQDPKIIGCLAWRPCYHRCRQWDPSGDNIEIRNNSILLNWRDNLWDLFDELALNHIYWWFLGVSGYLIHKDCITKEATYRWMKKGVRVMLATANSPLEKLHIVQNMQLGYFTDTLDAGDLTNSSTMANYSTVSLPKLQSSQMDL